MYSSRRSYEGILEQQRDPLTSLVNSQQPSSQEIVHSTAMDKVGSFEDTIGSGSSLSNLSALENETDDFGRLLLQHQRDARRLNNAVRGGREQAFRKARPKPRVAERLAREEHEEQQRLVNGLDVERGSSGGSDELEPAVTVPREWGRRARKQTDWLKKIVAPEENDRAHQHKSTYSDNLEWRSTANIPQQSIENTPPSTRRHRNPITPSSLDHMNTTLHPAVDFDLDNQDEQDWTNSASFLASTPAPTRYHRKIDELARREIQELETQAVTTRALDEIDQRSPNATFRRTSSSRVRERGIADRLRSPVVSPVKSTSPSRIPVRRQYVGGSSDKENVPLDGRLNGWSKSERKVKVDATAEPVMVNIRSLDKARAANTDGAIIGGRPTGGHSRNDSMNLLRKLARVSSMSPSPARSREGEAEHDLDPLKGNAVNPREKVQRMDSYDILGTGVNSTRANQSRKPHRDSQPESAETEDGEIFVKWKPEEDAFVETKAPVSYKNEETNEKGPAPEHDSAAYGDLQPANASQSLADEAQVHAIVEGVARLRPNYPRSALEAIVREAKAEQTSQVYGESTIQSLENIANPNIDATDTTGMSEFSALVDKDQEIAIGEPETQAEKDRRQEELAMEAMDKHLRTARTSIKDAGRGLRRVENKIETNGKEPPQPQRHSTTTNKLAPVVPTTRNATEVIATDPAPCAHCKTHSSNSHYNGSIWLALWTELRSNFYTYTPHPPTNALSSYLPNIRLTWLGLFILLWCTWFISESTLCEIYCHPFYAHSHVGFGVDPDAPRFPFVIPTLVFRPVRWLWKPACEGLVAGMDIVVQEVLGRKIFDPEEPRVFAVRKPERQTLNVFREEFLSGRGWAATATSMGVRAAHSVVDAVDEVGSMWNDEFLG